MHCCFGIGALVSPLFIRASQSVTSTFHGAFFAFSFILFASAMSFLFLPSPQTPQGPSPEGDGTSSGFVASLRRMSPATLCLLFSVALLLGVYVGNEVSFGAYVLVYSHERLGLDEVGPPLLPPQRVHDSPNTRELTYVLQSSGQYLTALYW